MGETASPQCSATGANRRGDFRVLLINFAILYLSRFQEIFNPQQTFTISSSPVADVLYKTKTKTITPIDLKAATLSSQEARENRSPHFPFPLSTPPLARAPYPHSLTQGNLTTTPQRDLTNSGLSSTSPLTKIAVISSLFYPTHLCCIKLTVLLKSYVGTWA